MILIYCQWINYDHSTRLYYDVGSKQTEVIYVSSGDFGPVHSRSDPCNHWAFMGSAQNPLRSKQNGHHFANDIFNAFRTKISIFFCSKSTDVFTVCNTSVTRPHFVKAASLTMIRVIGQSNHGSTIRRINTLFLTWLKFDLNMDKYVHPL